jgi:hypothetical protein
MREKVPNITKKQLLPYIRKAWRGIRAELDSAKKRLGCRYNNKNNYEKLCGRLCNPDKEPGVFFDEYMLCLNKASEKPLSVREVIMVVGGIAVDMYLQKRKERLEKRRLQRKKKKE